MTTDQRSTTFAALADPTREPLALFHLRQLLPQAGAFCAAATEGAAPLYAIAMA